MMIIELTAPSAGRAQDVEAEAWPEIDVWINVDDAGKDRIFILNSFAAEPNVQYEETALGVSWDRRFSPRTPLDGLYLCGAATHPGGSVIGLNGRNAAMAVLADDG